MSSIAFTVRGGYGDPVRRDESKHALAAYVRWPARRAYAVHTFHAVV
jgi:hypothetical protein